MHRLSVSATVFFFLNVLRVPNCVANGAQVNVFHIDVVISHVDDLTWDCIVCSSTSSSGFCRFILCISNNGGPVCILCRIVVAIAWALHVGAQNGADSRKRRVQLSVFVDNMCILTGPRLERRLRHHHIVNSYGVVFMPTVSTVVNDSIGFRESDIIHVAAFRAKVHWLIPVVNIK
jgi:hypothetical protein